MNHTGKERRGEGSLPVVFLASEMVYAVKPPGHGRPLWKIACFYVRIYTLLPSSFSKIIHENHILYRWSTVIQGVHPSHTEQTY